MNVHRILLKAFGDLRSHTYLEVIATGGFLFKSQKLSEQAFKRLLEYGLVKREWKSPILYSDSYIISQRGLAFLKELRERDL